MLDKQHSPSTDHAKTWTESAKELAQTPWVEAALATVAVGAIVVSRGKLTSIAERFLPKAGALLGDAAPSSSSPLPSGFMFASNSSTASELSATSIARATATSEPKLAALAGSNEDARLTRLIAAEKASTVELAVVDAAGKWHQGSGVLLNVDGDSRWIATGNHVVSPIDSNASNPFFRNVMVKRTDTLHSEDPWDHFAEIRGTDQPTDAAILKITGRREGHSVWNLEGRTVTAEERTVVPPLGTEIVHLGRSNGRIVSKLGAVEGIGPARTQFIDTLPEHSPTGELIKTSAEVSRGQSGGGAFGFDGTLYGLNSFRAPQRPSLADLMCPRSAIMPSRHFMNLLDRIIAGAD